MDKFFKLLKIDLINSFAFNTYKKTKKNKGKSLGPVVTLLISAVAMLFLMSIYSFTVGSMCVSAGKIDVLIIYGVGLGGLLSFMMSLGKSYSILFQAKDYEFLNTLPIKTSAIMTSKITSLIIVNFAFFNLGFVPSWIMYMIFGGFSVVSLLVGLVIVLLGPIFTCVLCTFLATLLGVILQKSRFKNAVQVVASIAFLIIVFFSSYSISYGAGAGASDEQYTLEMVNNIENLFSKMYFLAPMASKAIKGDLISLLLFVLISIVPLFILIFLTSKLFVRLNERSKETYKNKNFKLDKELAKGTLVSKKENKNRLVFKSLLFKEIKTIFTNSTYAMNVLVGPIISIVSSVFIVYTLINSEVESPDELEGLMMFAVVFSFIMAGFSMGMAPSSATSINVEGKNFWIIRSAPISEKLILFTKAFTYVVLCIPAIIIVPIANVILTKMGILDMILMMLALLAIVWTYSCVALWVNCLVPKLKWNNMTEAVKQSAGTLITMLVNLVLDVIIFAPGVIITFMFGVDMFFIALPTGIIAGIIASLILFTSGVNRFKRITCE